MKEIIQKIRDWKSLVEQYDRLTISSAVTLTKIEERQSKFEANEIINLQEEHNSNIKKLDEIGKKILNMLQEIVIAISTDVENKALRGSLVTLMLSSPDFAGLDEKAIQTLDSNKPNMQTISFAHQIFIEHSKMIADKAIKALQSN